MLWHCQNFLLFLDYSLAFACPYPFSSLQELYPFLAISSPLSHTTMALITSLFHFSFWEVFISFRLLIGLLQGPPICSVNSRPGCFWGRVSIQQCFKDLNLLSVLPTPAPEYSVECWSVHTCEETAQGQRNHLEGSEVTAPSPDTELGTMIPRAPSGAHRKVLVPKWGRTSSRFSTASIPTKES